MKEKKQIKIDKKQAWRVASNIVYPLVSFALVIAAMIFVMCLCAIMYVLRYDRYSPL